MAAQRGLARGRGGVGVGGQRAGAGAGARGPCALRAAKPGAVLVNSSHGKMGHSTAEAVVDAGLNLVPLTFTADPSPGSIDVRGQNVALEGLECMEASLARVQEEAGGDLMVVDYTLPQAVNPNAELYAKLGIPFVMGTTGGDRAALARTLEDSALYAVISPNMGKQIVALQSMLTQAAEDFPGAWSGYTMKVTESHQSTKVDTSGTAKALVECFQGLGLKFDVSEIELLREREGQLAFGVPEEHLNTGHAFHTYTLTSPDGSVEFEFKHNVCGRRIYAEGSVDACIFLKSQIDAGSAQRVFSMQDVLRAGAMG